MQHALLEAGAITLAANDFVRIPNTVNKAVEKLADMAPRDDDAIRKREWFISAPGKVILFGEHAVVHGVVSSFIDKQHEIHSYQYFSSLQTALAASVDLRCYGLSSPRDDGKVSVRLTNVSNHYHEWDIDDLPWDAASPVPPGESHADVLDQRLMDAIIQRALPPVDSLPPKTHGALLAFLYLYMSISYKSSDERFVQRFVLYKTR